MELQAYLNEVSLDGTGPNGGIGQVYECGLWKTSGVPKPLLVIPI